MKYKIICECGGKTEIGDIDNYMSRCGNRIEIGKELHYYCKKCGKVIFIERRTGYREKS